MYSQRSANHSGIVLVQHSRRDLKFYSGRCIHAINCELQPPSVFKAKTPGSLIVPDSMTAAALVAVISVARAAPLAHHRRNCRAD